MAFSLKLLSLLFVVSNVYCEEVGQACLDLLELENIGEHCCESVAVSQSFEGDLATCFTSDEMTCENFECLLNKRGVMNGHLVDEDAVKKHLDKIIQNRPEEKALVEQVQEGCLGHKYDDYSKDNECPAADLFACIFVNVNIGCPKWKTTEKCSKMSESAKKCKEYVEGGK